MYVFSTRADGWEQVRERAKASRTAVYFIALGHEVSDEIATLCRETGGEALAATSAQQVLAACDRVSASLASQYSVDYVLPADHNGRVKVQVYSEEGFGEDVFPAVPVEEQPAGAAPEATGTA